MLVAEQATFFVLSWLAGLCYVVFVVLVSNPSSAPSSIAKRERWSHQEQERVE